MFCRLASGFGCLLAAVLLQSCASIGGGGQRSSASISLKDTSRVINPRFTELNGKSLSPTKGVKAPVGTNTAKIAISWSKDLRQEVEFPFELPASGSGGLKIFVDPYPPRYKDPDNNAGNFISEYPEIFPFAPVIVPIEATVDAIVKGEQKKKYKRDVKIKYIILRLENNKGRVVSHKKYPRPQE